MPVDNRPELLEIVKPEIPKRTALVHILSERYQGIEGDTFDDVPESQIERSDPELLRRSLIDVRPNRRDSNTVWFIDPESNSRMFIAVTPLEHKSIIIRDVKRFAISAELGVLAARDRKLRSPNNGSERARTDDDKRTAARGAVRQVQTANNKMQRYLDETILPNIELTDKFLEMSSLKNLNLNRGNSENVKASFELLDNQVFGDMLDAIGLYKGWNEDLTKMAKRVLQKRIYLAHTRELKVERFRGMLELAKEYNGYKRAMLLTQIAKSRQYVAKRGEVLEDIRLVDEERAKQD